MSHATWCRLCVTICNDYIRLYDANGRCKVDLYEITVKYFHPMFLEMLNESPLTVMCSECWRQISEFDNFQKSILLAQSKLVPVGDKIDAEEDLATATTVVQNSVKVKDEQQLMDVHDDVINLDDEKTSSPEMYKFPNKFSPTHKEDSGDISQNSMYNDIEQLPEEYDDPVGVFTGGEFNDDAMYCMPHSLLELNLSEANTDDEYSITPSESGIDDKTAKQPNMCDPQIENNTSLNISSGNASRRTSSELLDEHIAKWRPTLDCPICSEPSANFACLVEHFKEHHPEVKSHITCCQRKFYTRSTMAEHARLHFDPNDFKCELCGKVCGSTKSLMRHQHVQHQRQHKGARTKINKKSAKELDAIINQWKPNLECVLCSATHPTFTELQRHFYTQHPNEKFYVECCQQKLELRWQTADHMQLHIDPNAFKCQLCGRFFTSSRNLYAHMYYTHSITAGGGTVKGRCYYKCSRCDKTFVSRGCLQEHMAMHTGQELYKCLYCPQKFRYRTKLYTHLKHEHSEEWSQQKNVRSLYKLMEINGNDESST